MRKCTITFTGVSPYSQGKHITEVLKSKELPKDFEARTWRQRMHVDNEGYVFIPPMAFKNGLAEVAKFLGEQIPGRGKERWTKNFEAGILVTEPVRLPIKAADVIGNWLFLPSDGKRGGDKRVDKCFPLITTWGGVVEVFVLDDMITEEVFERFFRQMGQFIGLGVFRPRKNGYFGRFVVDSFKWSTV